MESAEKREEVLLARKMLDWASKRERRGGKETLALP